MTRSVLTAIFDSARQLPNHVACKLLRSVEETAGVSCERNGCDRMRATARFSVTQNAAVYKNGAAFSLRQRPALMLTRGCTLDTVMPYCPEEDMAIRLVRVPFFAAQPHPGGIARCLWRSCLTSSRARWQSERQKDKSAHRPRECKAGSTKLRSEPAKKDSTFSPPVHHVRNLAPSQVRG